MDADCQERRRDSDLSRREKRWSMNSQRLEEIVAELMKPISDVRRSFDTDLSALLEEYLTEAGLHALEASDGEGAGAAPNFSELALLLQHSASVYGRKVDFLYQHVLSVSDSLQASAAEVSGAAPSEPATPSGKRKRRSSIAAADDGSFAPIVLSPSCAARRSECAPRPPPTLPRIYVELEPRTMTDHDVPLTDYEREPIGLLADFQVTWRLQDGLLVDTLEGGGGAAADMTSAALRPIPLLELQAALDAAAPPDPPPPLPLSCSTPLPLPLHDDTRDHTPAPATPPPNTLKKERKRRSDGKHEYIGSAKILVSKELRRKLSKKCEFTVAEEWIACVIEARKKCVLAARRGLKRDHGDKDFRGFDCTDSIDIGGFPGWSCEEGSAARASHTHTHTHTHTDSDDDGFFEQSSLGDSDGSRGDDSHSPSIPSGEAAATGSASWLEWQRGVVERAAAGEARGLHVGRLAERVLAQLPAAGSARPFSAVLAAAAAERADVAGLFLATLFLADAGNVRLLPAAPLTLDSFAVQLVSADRRRLHDAVLRHAAPDHADTTIHDHT